MKRVRTKPSSRSGGALVRVSVPRSAGQGRGNAAVQSAQPVKRCPICKVGNATTEVTLDALGITAHVCDKCSEPVFAAKRLEHDVGTLWNWIRPFFL